ncbi:MAG: FHA domain-containing protein [Anaerolineae bacterium]|nr:FHA domain-containing protein [Anaerolineae bacterium]MCA9909154.1 FHA domain-containing protein [Anaerolineae bacterium]
MKQLTLRRHPDNLIVTQVRPPAHSGYVLGRSDDNSDFIPDIDLAQFGARELGVSRRHAALVSFQGATHLIDLGSVNGTFLNGKRLISEMPYPVISGNIIRVGTLQLVIDEDQ